MSRFCPKYTHLKASLWRSFFGASLSAACLGLTLSACSQPKVTTTVVDAAEKSLPLIVGTYSDKGSQGVYRIDLDPKTGAFAAPVLLEKAVDPTFLATSDKGVVYAVLREDKGKVAAFSPSEQGQRLSLLNKFPSQGGSPCYLAFDPSQRFIASANYMGGNVAVFEIDEGGELKAEPVILQHEGVGHNPNRQEAAHAHWVQWSPFDPQWMYVVDLGLDEVRRYDFDVATGRFSDYHTAFKSKPGAGPRHMVFHPRNKWVYILNELDNTLTAGALQDDGSIEEIHTLSTLPANFTEHSQGAHIYITRDGKHIYTSNRGHNSIAHFTVDNTGRMTMQKTVSTLGDWPRYFSVLEKQKLMLVANKNSGDIFSFKISDDGSLRATGEKVDVGSPTYVEPFRF